jgi:hypothetical protein
MSDKEAMDSIIRKISDIALLEMKIRAQMNEILVINRFLRDENDRLRAIIAASKHTRMTLISSGLAKGDEHGKADRNNDKGPSDDAS